MLSKSVASLLPPLSLQEKIDTTMIQSIATNSTQVINSRPYRAPHHSTTRIAMLGGGAQLMPGEISLAHHGVLFLDEIPEFPREIIESLRQPLEEHKISIARANIRTEYPADFMLVAAMNPCPCGYFGSADHQCKCTDSQLRNYRKKLSGPFLDRIDISIDIQNQSNSVLLKNTTPSTHEHASAKKQIELALNKQFNRYQDSTKTNASLSTHEIYRYLDVSTDAKELLDLASDRLHLSARSYFKIIKVSQTILDLSASRANAILPEHISEALQYRQISFD